MRTEDVTQMEPPELAHYPESYKAKRQARHFRLRAAEHWLCRNTVFAYNDMLRAFDCLEAYVRDALQASNRARQFWIKQAVERERDTAAVKCNLETERVRGLQGRIQQLESQLGNAITERDENARNFDRLSNELKWQTERLRGMERRAHDDAKGVLAGVREQRDKARRERDTYHGLSDIWKRWTVRLKRERDELIERAEKAEQQLHAAKSEADYWRKTVMAERGR